MSMHKKLIVAVLLGNVAVAAPLTGLYAAQGGTTVQTPKSRYETVMTTTPNERAATVTQKAQEAQGRATTWRGMTPNERQDAYPVAAQDARQKAGDAQARAVNKADAVNAHVGASPYGNRGFGNRR